MLKYYIQRLALAFVTIFGVSLLIFSLMRMVPGDPALLFVEDMENVELIEQVRLDLGLDKSLPQQYLRWISKVVQGDLGHSIMHGEPVLEAITKRFTITAQLVLTAVTIAALIGIPAGMLAAWRQNRAADFAIIFTAIVCVSLPAFWIGLILILIFGVELNWLPTVGFVSLADNVVEGIRHMILPVICLLLTEVAVLIRMTRSSTIDVLRQEYITHARAKGLSESNILIKHVFKNSFAPTMTIIAIILGGLLGGAAVVEMVFTIPGLGRFLVEGIYSRDYPVIQGVLLLIAFIYTTLNLLADLLYPFFDPRVKLS